MTTDDSSSKNRGKNNIQIYIEWKPPENNLCTLNIDGVVTSESKACNGGLIRDSRGRWNRGYAKFLG